MEKTIDKYLSLFSPLLTDFYQFTMIYSYWKNKRHNERASFDLYFRKNPFNACYSIFSGLDEIKYFLNNLKFTDDDITYLKTQLPQAENEFFLYLKNMKMDDIVLVGVNNNEIVLPHTPLLTLTGDLAKIQLIETPLLNLVNYSSLISTLSNEIRLKYPSKELIEVGSESAQTSFGSILGLKYSIGNGLINSTTNIESSYIYNLPNYNSISYDEAESEDYNYLIDAILEGKGINKELFFNIISEQSLKINKKFIINALSAYFLSDQAGHLEVKIPISLPYTADFHNTSPFCPGSQIWCCLLIPFSAYGASFLRLITTQRYNGNTTMQ